MDPPSLAHLTYRKLCQDLPVECLEKLAPKVYITTGESLYAFSDPKVAQNHADGMHVGSFRVDPVLPLDTVWIYTEWGSVYHATNSKEELRDHLLIRHGRCGKTEICRTKPRGYLVCPVKVDLHLVDDDVFTEWMETLQYPDVDVHAFLGN